MNEDNKKRYLVFGIILLSVAVISLSGTYAYFVASVGGSGNTTNNQANVTTVDLGSIYYEGETTFTGTDIYPGMVSVQTFKIGPQGDTGSGTYQVILENNLPEEFLEDVIVFLAKTTDPENNYLQRIEGELVQDENGFAKEDNYNIVGSPEILVTEFLTTKGEMILETVNFDVSTMEETTYFLGYQYENSGVQNVQQGLTFTGTIKVNLVSASEEVIETEEYKSCVTTYGVESPQCQILAEYDGNPKCPTIDDKGNVSVKNLIYPMMGYTDPEAYMCSAPDDYGISYYYVGPAENNWVKFGGYYWRIIRVNGDGSIRMIYAGDASVIDALDATTKAQVLSNGYNDESTDYTQIGTSYYNYYWKKDNVQEAVNSYVYNDNAGVGYMYGNRNGIVEGTKEYSSSWRLTDTYYVSKEYNYDATTDRFTLKNPIAVLASEMTSEYIGYYTHNQSSASASYNYIEKIRSVSKDNDYARIGYSDVRYGTTSKVQAQTNTNDSDIKVYLDNWYATNLASYSNYISDTLFCNDRSLSHTLPNTDYTNLSYGVEPTAYRNYYIGISKLRCEQQNDRFTVDDEVVGNGDLTYPIGLLTTDEVVLAGGMFSNNLYYLYTGNWYWTMSPSNFNGYFANVKVVNSNGSADSRISVLDSFDGARPVINLKSGSLTKGSGSASDPWMVE